MSSAAQHPSDKGWDEFPEAYYEAYIGKSAPYYLQQLQRLRNGQLPAFHWPAFFLGFLWMVYRRMYVVGLALFLLLLLEGSLEEGLCALLGVSANSAEWLGRISGLVINLLVGTYASRIYLWDVRRQMRQALRSGPQHVEALVLENLSKQGGTSWQAVLLVIGAVLALGIMVFVLMDLFI